jgi:hypothetical protein
MQRRHALPIGDLLQSGDAPLNPLEGTRTIDVLRQPNEFGLPSPVPQSLRANRMRLSRSLELSYFGNKGYNEKGMSKNDCDPNRDCAMCSMGFVKSEMVYKGDKVMNRTIKAMLPMYINLNQAN